MRTILEMAQQRKDETIRIRRELHMYPEPSFQEFETAKCIMRELDAMGIPYRSVTETGIVAEINGGLPGKTIALRADMDALEVLEKTGEPFASRREGFMHACGHDAHVASLLGAADILRQCADSMKGQVLLVFQPAEEFVQGAEAMMRADAFMDTVDAVIGMHVMPDLLAGTIGCRDKGTMFAGEKFNIHVTGKSGHGATPHLCVDALMAASAIVMHAQSLLSRELDARETAVVTICTCDAGTRHNVIAGEAELTGTYRFYNEEIRSHIRESLTRIAKDTASAFRATAEVVYTMYVPPVFNDAALGKIVRASAAAIVGEAGVMEVEGRTGSDDFSYFQQKAPGFYFFVGCGDPDPEKRFSNHHAQFHLDEDCLPVAAAMFAQTAMDYLNA